MSEVEMRALTTRQPWTGCIAWLGKRTENRSKPFPPALIGADIAIHAGLAVDADALMSIPVGANFPSLFGSPAEWDAFRFRSPRSTPRTGPDWPPKLILGAVIAVAKVTGCHPWSWDKLCGPEREFTSPSTPGLCSPWALRAPWHWDLADVRVLPEPIPALGAQGLWRLPDTAAKAVRAQLER